VIKEDKVFGIETPRKWTKPLRELTPATSHGFHVIEFALRYLGLELYPWQKWLLIHSLELNLDGTYRFRRVVVLVARQNGKTLLLNVLTLWWLFVDSDSFPEHVEARDFLVLGTAQNLDIAEESWESAVGFCDPDSGKDGSEVGGAVAILQAQAMSPVRKNGQKALRLKSGARYEVRAANRKGGRGKSATRIVMDEMREQQTWDAWAAISKTMGAKFNSQLWGISNAGDAKSIVLGHIRTAALAAVAAWDEYVAAGLRSVEEWANDHDPATGLFEWSALEDCGVDDVDQLRQANPSLGWSPMTVTELLAQARSEPDATFRTETMCQWVTALIVPYLDSRDFADCLDAGSRAAADSPLVLGVDTSADRQMSYVSVAGLRDDGLQHGELIMQRAGMLWVPDFVVEVCEKQGIECVALQARGAPAAEFKESLEEAGLTVIEISGTALGAATGRMGDRVREKSFRHLGQPPVLLAVAAGVTRKLGEVRVWDRSGSEVDIAPLVSMSNALYGLENVPEEEGFESAYAENDLVVL
jgi:phage terminase large subunit-like protein